ncbi:AfsR/SARP family transcriptional regulator [Nonomuraea sp. NPDC003707]
MSEAAFHFGVLGTLDVKREGKYVAIPAAKQRIILATLLLNVNEFVSRDHLTERVWNGDVPCHARGVLHTHVSRLRRILREKHPGEDRLIHSHRDSYAMRLKPDDMDLSAFRELTRQAISTSQASTEVDILGRALALWRGPALADVPSKLLHEIDVPLLDEERGVATERLLHLRLQLGDYEATIVPLKAMTGEHPFRERLWAHLMVALFLSDRRAEALDAYRAVVALLREELGIDPGPELVRIHAAILAGDPQLARLLDESQLETSPSLDAQQQTAEETPQDRESTFESSDLLGQAGFPQQLPSDVVSFTGRSQQLQILDNLLAANGDEPSPRMEIPREGDEPSRPIVIASLTGMGGIGKTSLAVHWAHRMIHHFPDGALYVNLRGFGPDRPLEPGAALEMLLDTLGVPITRIPDQIDARSALFRSVLGHRRILLLLDNAQDAAQVRPLLPGSHAFVLITSRNQLRGMAAREGAHRIPLQPLSADESVELLTKILGPERIDIEPQAASELAHSCAYLPLALNIAAELATSDSSTGLRDLAEQMHNQRARLDLLDTVDDHEASLRAVLSWSCRALPASAGRVFRLLSLHPGAVFDPPAAAAMAGITSHQARQILDLLADRSLLERPSEESYSLHDLIHAYAIKLTHDEDTDVERTTAVRRVLDWYLHAAELAADQLEPSRRRFPPAIVHVPAEPVVFDGPGDAVAWVQDRHAILLTAITLSAHHGWNELTWRLPHVLWRFFLMSGHIRDWIDSHHLAVPAARNSLVPGALAETLKNLGFAYWRRGHLPGALDYHAQALVLDQQDNDLWGEAKTRNHLGFINDRAGRTQQALDQHWRSLALYEETDDLCGKGRALIGIGNASRQLGYHAEALDHLNQALIITRQIGDRWGESLALITLGLVCLATNDHGDAMDHFTTGLRITRDNGDRWGESLALVAIGLAYLAGGQSRQALDYLGQALAVARDVRSTGLDSDPVLVDSLHTARHLKAALLRGADPHLSALSLHSRLQSALTRTRDDGPPH